MLEGGGGAFEADWRELSQMTSLEVYELLRLRVDVFVVEQECAYSEIDGRDHDALHLRLVDGGGGLAAALRVFPPVEGGAGRIGRVVVAPNFRGRHLGDMLMRKALKKLAQEFGAEMVELSAQSHLRRFYEKHGFQTCSAEYLEDGIPHVEMRRKLAAGEWA